MGYNVALLFPQLKGAFMSYFEDVAVKIAANVYFDGAVTSRTIIFADGSEKTLGLMLPGEYEFGTGAPELMQITTGKLRVQLPGSVAWTDIVGGESFEVPGDSKFKVEVSEVTDYMCSFLD